MEKIMWINHGKNEEVLHMYVESRRKEHPAYNKMKGG
jgi:hypothetical protein